MELYELIITCNSCGWRDFMEELYLVPDVGKLVCKACSLKEETQVIPMKDMDESNLDNGW